VFEDRVQRALVKLGVPSREDLNDLSARVETLTEELRRQGGKPAAARKAPAKAAKKAAKAPARRPRKAKADASAPE
jgi:hypothetical protein